MEAPVDESGPVTLFRGPSSPRLIRYGHTCTPRADNGRPHRERAGENADARPSGTGIVVRGGLTPYPMKVFDQRGRCWRNAPLLGRMFLGIAPLGICGRDISAPSRLSSELTSLPVRFFGRRSIVERSLRIDS
jgi:hypothetical protein